VGILFCLECSEGWGQGKYVSNYRKTSSFLRITPRLIKASRSIYRRNYDPFKNPLRKYPALTDHLLQRTTLWDNSSLTGKKIFVIKTGCHFGTPQKRMEGET